MPADFSVRRCVPTDLALEYGAGGTTTFFAPLVAHLDSVEAIDEWYEPLAARLSESGIDNVSLHLISAEKLGYQTVEHREAYVNVRPDLDQSSLDFVFVDGEYRDEWALRGVELVRPGGLLVLDNSEQYLPSRSRSPWRVDRPASEGWEEFVGRIEDWRQIWTSNGVWDTTIWVKE